MSKDVVPSKARVTVPMVTRRTAIGAGLAFASMVGVGTYASAAPRGREALSVDALIVDETIPMPRSMAAVVEASREKLPVVGIQLDGAGQAGLMRLLNNSHTIIGISSGATLFCLERIAWDHGFRLAERSQHCSGDLADNACQQAVTRLLIGMHPPVASSSSLARAYRPSRADGMLHVWVLQKSSSPRLRQGREA